MMSNKKNILIDYEYIDSKNLTPQAVLYLHKGVRDGFDDMPEVYLLQLEEDGLIKIGPSKKVSVRQLGLDILEVLTIDMKVPKEKLPLLYRSKTTKSVEVEVGERIQEYRKLWSGLKVGAMGDPKACRDKMIRWMKENPSYTFDDILNAAKAYISSLDSYTYLQRADYFIYKQDRNKVDVSRLSSFIEDGVENNLNWDTNLI